MTEKLPGVLAEIASVDGEAAALAIASRAGGTRIYLPARADDQHWLVATVGRAAADKLCEHFAIGGQRGQRIEIPLFVGGTYKQLRRAIHQRFEELEADGESSQRIARVTGVTQRTVHRKRSRRRQKQDGKQGRLL